MLLFYKKQVGEKMKKIIHSTLLVFLVFSLLSCSEDSQSKTPQKGTLYFALFRVIPDVYQDQMFDFIKKNSIKTISIVAKDLTTEKEDSLTYLEFNDEGKIIRRNTIECTTLGCLPYNNRQVYSYKDGKIDRIDQYTFANNSKPTLYYWMLRDTSKMNLFDWEDFSYKGDSVFSESAISSWIFVNDSNDNFVYRSLMVNSAKHNKIENNFSYTDSAIQTSSKGWLSDNVYRRTIKLTDNGIKIFDEENDEMKLIQKWHMNSKGLPKSIDTYSDGKQKRIITLEYTFY